jgi:hypothetical protein
MAGQKEVWELFMGAKKFPAPQRSRDMIKIDLIF